MNPRKDEEKIKERNQEIREILQKYRIEIEAGRLVVYADDLEPEEWKITCERFALYAPEENPVEAIWFQLKSLLRRFYRFGKNFKIINHLFQLFAKYELFNFPHLERFDAFSQLI